MKDEETKDPNIRRDSESTKILERMKKANLKKVKQ